MTEVPDRARRAFRDHDGFEPTPRPGVFTPVTTPFDAEVAVAAREDGAVGFEVTVRVPSLSAATADHVAAVVEEGWYETFELRIEDVGDVTRGDHDLDPSVRRAGDEVVVTLSFGDLDPRRGVDDALAFVNFVEGTYVQGVVPGYEYVDPVAGILAEARRAAGAED
jgi:hypothetical protein